jgi:gamma-glutamylcyclotransferase (GGCT)/AIG2-like uncharacterized protein YtfP
MGIEEEPLNDGRLRGDLCAMPTHAGTGPTLCFAYGSNMNRPQMRERCPEANAVGNAVLSGWRFRINTRGYATIVPDDDGVVHGLLWTLTGPDESALDRYEGVAQDLYTKRQLVVRAQAGPVEAMAYVATDSRVGVTEDEYFLRIIEGATEARLPADYLAELDSWKPKGPAPPRR